MLFFRVVVLKITESEMILKQIDFGGEITADLQMKCLFLPSTAYFKTRGFYSKSEELASLIKEVDFSTLNPGAVPCKCSEKDLGIADKAYDNSVPIEFSVTSYGNLDGMKYQYVKIQDSS